MNDTKFVEGEDVDGIYVIETSRSQPRMRLLPFQILVEPLPPST